MPAGFKADLEVISTAVLRRWSAMRRADYRIEIWATPDFSRLVGIMRRADDDEKEASARAIEAKNYAALSDLLDPSGDSPAVRAIAKPAAAVWRGGGAERSRGACCGEAERSEAPLTYLKHSMKPCAHWGLRNR